MAIMDIEDFDYDLIKDMLKGKGKDAYKLISYVDYLDEECVRDLISELNGVFNSRVGNRAYPSWNFITDLYVLF